MVFRASDLETGRPVTVRRFFPRGTGEAGLNHEERTAFEIAVQRFACATHPALRSVIAGGCDPVDGIPFIVSEWLDGPAISQNLANGVLPSRRVVDILMSALEVSEVISQLLAEQAVWVETDPVSIIETEASDRGATFALSPLKWLDPDEERRSLKPLVQLTEDLMGWKNKLLNDSDGNGLASWLKWLKQNAFQTTLAEARENLAAATGAPPPPPTSRLVRQSTRPMAPRAATVQVQAPQMKRKKASKAPMLLSAGCLLVLLGIGAWFAKTGEIPFQKQFQTAKAEVAPPVRKSALDYAPPIVPRELEEEAPVSSPSLSAAKPSSSSVDAGEKIYRIQDADALLKKENQTVTLEGKLKTVSYNTDKTQIFLQMEKTEQDDACGYVISKDATGGLSFDELKKLEEKTIRIRGRVGVGVGSFGKRPKILIKDRASIMLP